MTEGPKFARVDLDGLQPLGPDSLARQADELWRVARRVRGPDVEFDLLCAFVQGDGFSPKVLAGAKPECHAVGHGDALGHLYAACMLIDAAVTNMGVADHRAASALYLLRGFLREKAGRT